MAVVVVSSEQPNSPTPAPRDVCRPLPSSTQPDANHPAQDVAGPELFRKNAHLCARRGNCEAAAQTWFAAGELFQKAGNVPVAIECFRDAIVARMATTDASKDWYNSAIEDRLRELSVQEPEFALRAFRRLEASANANCFYELSDTFHVLECNMALQLFRRQRFYGRCAVYMLWNAVCGYGVSLRRWLLSTLVVLLLLAFPIAVFDTRLFVAAQSVRCVSRYARVPLQAVALLFGGSTSLVDAASLWGHVLTVIARLLALILLAGAANLVVARLRGKE
jgi:hypothetical protein